jgi:hypothetical protein
VELAAWEGGTEGDAVPVDPPPVLRGAVRGMVGRGRGCLPWDPTPVGMGGGRFTLVEREERDAERFWSSA